MPCRIRIRRRVRAAAGAAARLRPVDTRAPPPPGTRAWDPAGHQIRHKSATHAMACDALFLTHARVLFRRQALLRGGALRHAVAGLTGGIALGNVAVQEDHEGSRTAEGKAVAARRYAQAARVLRGALLEVSNEAEQRAYANLASQYERRGAFLCPPPQDAAGTDADSSDDATADLGTPIFGGAAALGPGPGLAAPLAAASAPDVAANGGEGMLTNGHGDDGAGVGIADAAPPPSADVLPPPSPVAPSPQQRPPYGDGAGGGVGVAQHLVFTPTRAAPGRMAFVPPRNAMGTPHAIAPASAPSTPIAGGGGGGGGGGSEEVHVPMMMQVEPELPPRHGPSGGVPHPSQWCAPSPLTCRSSPSCRHRRSAARRRHAPSCAARCFYPCILPPPLPAAGRFPA